MNDAYVSTIRYELGTPTPLDSFTEPDIMARANLLRQEGTRDIRVCDDAAWQLGARTAQRTLVAAGAVDDLASAVYSSEDARPIGHARALAEFLAAAGVPGLPAVNVIGHGCGNLGPTLGTAAAQLAGGGAGHVLLTLSECAGQRNRLVDHGDALLSDGSVSCLVGTTPVGPGLRILGIETVGLAPERGSSEIRAAARIRKGTQDAVTRLRKRLTTAPERLVLSNYGHSARSWLAAAAEMATDSVIAADVAGLGHCFSIDVLVTVAQAAQRAEIADGDSLLLLCSGPNTWSAIAAVYYG